MTFVFYTVQEIEDAAQSQPESKTWQHMYENDDRSPKKICIGRAYLIFVGTLLDAGFRHQAIQFEKKLTESIDIKLAHIPSIEKGRVWRAPNGKLQFIHY
jgi:hypothetical protein